VVLDGAAADRLAVQVHDEELPGGRPHLVRQRGGTDRRVEAALRAPVQLGDVLRDAVPRVGMLGVDGRDLDARRGQQALDLTHGRHQPLLLLCAQRREQRAGELVGALVEQGALGAAGGRQAGNPNPPVAPARRQLDQPGGLERAQQPAQIPRVQPQARPQEPHLAAVEPDLPQQPRLAERPLEVEEVVVERPDALGDRPVEAADLLDHRLGHSLTLVSNSGEVNAIQPVP